MNAMSSSLMSFAAPHAGTAARLAAHEALPWVPLSPGKSFKPLRFLREDRGFAELLRLEPGFGLPRHRHTGEVHALNLQGWRRIHSGERVGPGDYVYEPPGNVDSWHVVGDTPLIVLTVVMGVVEYLDDDGRVTRRYAAGDLLDLYHRHCVANGILPVDLVD